MAETAASLIVTVTPTVMDGTVVRWHKTEQAEYANRPFISASRNGVMIHGDVWLADLPNSLLQAALDAHRLIRDGGDVPGLATHRRPFGKRELIPVDAGEGRHG